MGQDISIVFVAEKLADEHLAEIAEKSFGMAHAANLLLLSSHSGPECVHLAIPAFTAVSIWADAELSLTSFAAELSRTTGKALIITMADHSLIGAWQCFENGRPGDGNSFEGDGYVECGIQGIEASFGIELEAEVDERLFFLESFVEELSGICVHGAGGGLRPGVALNEEQILAVLESDLDDIELECLHFPE